MKSPRVVITPILRWYLKELEFMASAAMPVETREARIQAAQKILDAMGVWPVWWLTGLEK